MQSQLEIVLMMGGRVCLSALPLDGEGDFKIILEITKVASFQENDE